MKPWRWALGACVALSACSVLTNLDDLGSTRSDGGDAGAGSDGGIDAEPDVAPPVTCKTAATTCVADAPSGWTGPFELYDGNPANVPSCPSPTVDVLTAHLGLIDAGGGCTPCSCSVTGVTCTTSVAVYSQPSCQGLPCATVDASACTKVNLGACSDSSLNSTSTAAATCTAGGAVPTGGAPASQAVQVGCKTPQSALKQVDCPAGQVCAAASTPPFLGALCVLQPGDVTCPGAPYVNKHVYYEAYDDGRKCNCACATQGPSACGGVLLTRASTLCANGPPTYPLNVCNGSTLIGGNPTSQSIVAQPTAPPLIQYACTVTGSPLSGAVVESKPTTVCCL